MFPKINPSKRSLELERSFLLNGAKCLFMVPAGFSYREGSTVLNCSKVCIPGNFDCSNLVNPSVTRISRQPSPRVVSGEVLFDLSLLGIDASVLRRYFLTRPHNTENDVLQLALEGSLLTEPTTTDAWFGIERDTANMAWRLVPLYTYHQFMEVFGASVISYGDASDGDDIGHILSKHCFTSLSHTANDFIWAVDEHEPGYAEDVRANFCAPMDIDENESLYMAYRPFRNGVREVQLEGRQHFDLIMDGFEDHS